MPMPSTLAWCRNVGAHTLEDLGRKPHRLAQRRMGMNGAPDVGGIGPHLDGKRQLRDQVTRMCPDDCSANDAVRCAVKQELGESFVSTIGDGTSRGCPRK